MTGSDDLSRKLAELADTSARFGAAGRVIADGGVPSATQAILKEVDETVLAQDLTFAFGTAGTLVLVVSGRRILGVRSVEGLISPALASQIVGQPVSRDEDATQKGLIACLMQLDLLTETVETRATASDSFDSRSGSGIGVARIAGLLGVEYPFVPPTRMTRFQAALPSVPAAELWLVNQSEGSVHGAPAGITRLRAAAEALAPPAKASADVPELTITGQQSSQNGLIGVAVDGETTFLWLLPTQDVGVTLVKFHEIFND